MREHTGSATGVAFVATFFLSSLAAVLVVFAWIALSVYAVVKAVGSAPDSADPVAVLLIIVGLVTMLALIFGGTVAFVGRSMTPRRRRAQEAAQLGLGFGDES